MILPFILSTSSTVNRLLVPTSHDLEVGLVKVVRALVVGLEERQVVKLKWVEQVGQ